MKIVVTAGPTREYLDPVRFLSNPSTGKMGFAIAAEAARFGHEVTLVAGPVALPTPRGVRRIDVISAREMLAAVRTAVADGADILVSAAAVADWRPMKCATRKLKKHEMASTLRLVRNPDILKSVKGVTKVGFAAETNNVLSEAVRKCREKGLLFIVANDVMQPGCGFGTDTNRVIFARKDGSFEHLPLLSKRAVARRIVKECQSVILSLRSKNISDVWGKDQ